jgi:hypothetical protein
MKVVRWSIFSVAFALLPIGVNGLSAATRNRGIAYDDLVGRGELLLVTAAIAAASAGELFGDKESRLRTTRLFLVGMSFLVVCLSSYWFADIAAGLQSNQVLDRYVIATGSSAVFIFAFIISACSIIVSELR